MIRIAVTVQSSLSQICVMLLSDSRQVSEYCHDCFHIKVFRIELFTKPTLLMHRLPF